MKAIIIFLLINYFLCSDSTIIGYVDISKFDQNDSMHLAIVVRSGKIDKIIHYGYSNEKSITSLSYTKDTTSSESYCSGDDDYSYCGTRYYYDIKKEENQNYLVIQCTGYTGESIDYSFLPMSAIGFYIMYIVIALVCIAICCSYGYYYKKKLKKNNVKQKTVQTPMIPKDYQPSNDNY